MDSPEVVERCRRMRRYVKFQTREFDRALGGERERERIRNTEILFNKAIAPFEGVYAQ